MVLMGLIPALKYRDSALTLVRACLVNPSLEAPNLLLFLSARSPICGFTCDDLRRGPMHCVRLCFTLFQVMEIP